MHPQDTFLIPLRAKDGGVRAYALIDTADADFVNQWTWSLHTSGYPYRQEGGRREKRKVYFLHRAILGLAPGDGLEVDHVSRDKLDNRRSNLRVIPHQGNSQNRPSHAGAKSAYRGVHWHKRVGKWVARIMVNGRAMHLGCFARELDAAEVARAARKRLMPGAID